MTGRQRALVPLALAVAVAVGAFALLGGRPGAPGSSPGSSASADSSAGSGSGRPLGPEPSPTPRPPLGGTELYGFLPYWQMNGAVADHLRSTPVTTLGLFSVAARASGQLNPNPLGYRRITGDIGRRLIREAHDRGTRVELVFTSFGPTRNGRFFGRLPVRTPATTPGATPGASRAPSDSGLSPGASAAPAVPPWHRTVRELVALAADLGVDGINVDVERLDPQDRTAYGEFLAALRAALRDRLPDAQLSVATEAGEGGIANAAVAAAAGVDRVFLMGYEYHWSGSPPGASSPVDRLDGTMTLRWSIARYVEAGVPRDRILLGLPLYGMRWRTTGPDRFFPVIGSGIPWLPSQNVDLLAGADLDTTHDPIEHADWFAVEDGDDWLITYFDTPATIRSKLALARDQGLAGGGFWALGYTRGLPGYGDLMRDFLDGNVGREEAPPPYP